MQLDVVISNPPYQDTTKSGLYTNGSMPMYNLFVNRFIDFHCRYMLWLIPSRWMCGGKSTLNEMRDMLVYSRHIKSIINYEKSDTLFGDLQISGGIQYILIDNKHDNTKNGQGERLIDFHSMYETSDGIEETVLRRSLGKYKCRGQFIIVQDNKAISIIDKVLSNTKTLIAESIVYNPFKLQTNYYGSQVKYRQYTIKTLASRDEEIYASPDDMDNHQLINYWKVCTGALAAGGGIYGKRTLYTVINKPFVIEPGVACTNTYIIFSIHKTKEEAQNSLSYLRTRFVRFLISSALSSIHITPKSFCFVPLEDFSSEHTDNGLYQKYGLSTDEITYIESRIKEL